MANRLETLRDVTCENCSFLNTYYCVDCDTRETFDKYIKLDKVLDEIFSTNESELIPTLSSEMSEENISGYKHGYIDAIKFIQGIVKGVKNGSI